MAIKLVKLFNNPTNPQNYCDRVEYCIIDTGKNFFARAGIIYPKYYNFKNQNFYGLKTDVDFYNCFTTDLFLANKILLRYNSDKL